MSALLAIDGDSFAHRAYHALPKTITRAGGRPAGAIVGFANMLIRLWDAERPRAVVVAWDTLEVADLPARGFRAATRAGASSTPPCSSSSSMLPELVARAASRVAKGAGYEADDFLAAAAKAEEAARRNGRRRHVRPRRVPARVGADDDPPAGARRVRAGAHRAGRGPRALRRRPRAGGRLHRAPRRSVRQAAGARGVGPKTAADVLAQYGSLEAALDGRTISRRRRRNFGSTVE